MDPLQHKHTCPVCLVYHALPLVPPDPSTECIYTYQLCKRHLYIKFYTGLMYCTVNRKQYGSRMAPKYSPSEINF